MVSSLIKTLAISFICLPMAICSELQSTSVNLQTKFGELKIEVHFASKNAKLAERVEQIAQQDLIKIVDYFQYSPKEIVHINIDSNTRLANGFARSFPTNLINLYTFPPSNDEHLIVMEDFWRGLIVHEFTHIIHLDQTRGYLEYGRKIFGSVAKLPPGIVPRWFTEGIAVWSESHLFYPGRLKNELYRKEIWQYLKENNNCSTIDCIDNSGKYPFGQLSYWIGSAFMEYLENNKNGTIRCLVEENSSELPFLLNKVFERCTGKTADENFTNFKYSFLKNYNLNNDSGDAVGEIFGNTNFQKGIIVNQNKVFKVERSKDSEALVMYDFENKINFYNKYSYPISSIVQYLKIDNENNGLLVAFNEDPNYKLVNKSWKIINDETLMIEKELEFETDPSYLLSIGKDLYLSGTFEKNLWHLRKVQFKNDNQINLYDLQLPNGENLVFFKIINSKLLVKLYNYPTNTSRLVMFDFNLQNSKVIYSSKKYFDVFGLTEKGLALKEEGASYFLSWDEANIYKSKLDFEKVKNTTFSIDTDKYKIAYEHTLLVNQNLGFKELSSKELIKTENISYDVYPDQKLNTESYPKLNHFRPHYWFINISGDENLTGYGVQTSINDPLELHTLEFSGKYYSPINKLGGTVAYTYNGENIDKKVLDQNLVFNVSFSKTFSTNTYNKNKTNQTTSIDSILSNQITNKRFTYLPGFVFGTENTQDNLSNRNTKYVGLRGAAYFRAMSYDDFIRQFSVISRLAIDTPNNGETFFNWQNKIETSFVIKNDLLLDGRFAFGKLFKDDFSRGVINGGGTNSSFATRWFEFYGLDYKNAYGNKLITSKLKLDYDFLDFYRGYQLTPAFLKEVHGLIGIEQLNADVIYIDGRFYSNSSISSIFAGVKLKTTLFYLASVDTEIIFSSIATPSNKRIGAGSFVLNSAF